MNAPFPYFGGKRTIADTVWRRLGTPTQYIEPFCGSAAVLLAAPSPASLEVVCDINGFIANFWRATKHQAAAVAIAADYPVSHIDLGAHRWLMEQRERLGVELQDADWPGDAKVAGWWLWGQCCWIGSGWCEWERKGAAHASDAGMGVQAIGQVPHASSAGMGVQAIGQVPHASDAGRGELLTSAGRTAWRWLHELAARLERVRVVHGHWSRCLNNHFGGDDTAVFLDPPCRSYEIVYGAAQHPVAYEVEGWAREHANLRIALCGHQGDYDLPGWDVVQWSRGRATYGGGNTTDKECVWFSPACLPVEQADLFSALDPQDERVAELFEEAAQ